MLFKRDRFTWAWVRVRTLFIERKSNRLYIRREIMGGCPIYSCFSNETRVSNETPDPEIRIPVCVICYENPVSTACLPCGHAVMCTSCSNKLTTSRRKHCSRPCTKCPICRSDVKVQNIVHLKYPEDAPHFHVDHAKLLARYQSVTDSSERALENAENITSQLLETVSFANELKQSKERIETIIDNFIHNPPLRHTVKDVGVQVTIEEYSAPSTPTSSLVVETMTINSR